MVVLSWLYPRAAFWLLDRDGIKGHFGETKLKPPAEDESDDEAEADTPVDKPEAIGPSGEIPDRHIYTLDLRDSNKHEAYVAEIRRIVGECRDRREAKAREKAVNSPAIIQLGLSLNKPEPEAVPAAQQPFTPEALLAAPGRRWYPVIDYSRCTNCLECLDFCLFGVYGVDSLERILVENQDQCKKGCPACSRVCPQQAIIFPEYKSAAIAGAETGVVGGLKIDLSRLFGGDVGDALSAAVQERDRELVNDGRDAVGMSVGIPKRQADKPQGPKDDLDKLVDDLDNLGL